MGNATGSDSGSINSHIDSIVLGTIGLLIAVSVIMAKVYVKLKQRHKVFPLL